MSWHLPFTETCSGGQGFDTELRRAPRLGSLATIPVRLADDDEFSPLTLTMTNIKPGSKQATKNGDSDLFIFVCSTSIISTR